MTLPPAAPPAPAASPPPDGGADPAARFAEAASAWIGERLAALEERRRAAQQRIDQHAREIVTESRALAQASSEARALRDLQATESARYREEFRLLGQVPGVRRVAFERDAVVLYTGPIVVEHAGRAHDVGDFRLDLFFNGVLRIRNVRNTGRYELYDHPHVRDGEPCLGNIGDGLVKLVAAGQFSVAARVLVEYLHGYDPVDAYCEIHHWKEVSRDGAHGESGGVPTPDGAH